MIEEEAFLHSKPAWHADFFTMHARVKMTPEKQGHLPEISPSISYYAPASDCGAGCHNRGAGVGSLSIVKQYAQDDLSLQQAIDEYDRRIATLAVENAEFDAVYISEGIVAAMQVTPLTDAYERYVVGTPE